jgi:D-alanine-D-alanine ligase-like ATP-grasp enzyme
MPRVIKGELPGMVFNLSYGVQGQARYTHVPGILEMVGIPYVGSGPLAHSLALDKVVAKMIFRQNSLPTPDFVVLNDPGFEAPDLKYPLIVKPKNESTLGFLATTPLKRFPPARLSLEKEGRIFIQLRTKRGNRVEKLSGSVRLPSLMN